MWVKVFVVSLPPWLLWFTLGIGWYRNWSRAPKGIGWFLIALASYILLSFVLYEPLSSLGPMRELLYGLPLSYATVWFGFQGPAVLRDLSKIGDLSYGVYVWHMVVINLMLYLNFANKASAGNPALVPAAVAVTLVLAWLSWWLVERPALRRKPYSSRGEPATPQP
jgi:peptidoglycan/LPS O-acetylase OafA/YrhL